MVLKVDLIGIDETYSWSGGDSDMVESGSILRSQRSSAGYPRQGDGDEIPRRQPPKTGQIYRRTSPKTSHREDERASSKRPSQKASLNPSTRLLRQNSNINNPRVGSHVEK